jgi:hypothetical protein
MTHPRYQNFALRSADPLQRSVDLLCVMILELLTWLVLSAPHSTPGAAEGLPADSILARFHAGDSFGLPRPLLWPLRATIRALCARIAFPSFASPLAASPAHPRRPVPRCEKSRPPAAPRLTSRPLCHTRILRPPRWPRPRISLRHHCRCTSISLRYGNI